jgi:hypothetical protein
MPKFNYSLDFQPDATIGNLIGSLTALIEHIKRAEPDESKLLNDVGSFQEYYDIKNPENSHSSRSDSA